MLCDLLVYGRRLTDFCIVKLEQEDKWTTLARELFFKV